MNTNFDAYKNALLADATYALTIDNWNNRTGEAVETELKERMTPTLAKYIGENFTVVTHIETPDVGTSGFDATVWRENASGKLYVSMQGTKGASDFLTDVKLTFGGNAGLQIIDMANWWLRITTPVGQMARQIGTEVDPVSGFVSAKSDVPGTGLVSAADLAKGVEVNGHSLGGYLATAFTRLFGSQAHVTHTNTFNSAGFAPGSESAFANLQNLIGQSYGLGRFPNASEQSNYFAVNGINVTTNSLFFNQQGWRVELFQEEGTGIPNHSMFKLTDMLALGAAMEKLDPGIDIGKLNALMPVGANQAAASIEGLFDALRRAVEGPGITASSVGDEGDSAPSRVAYHAALAKFNLDHQNLAGKLSIGPAARELDAQARGDFAAIVALQDLSPIIVRGKDAAGDALLAQQWQSTRAADYAAWQADKSAATPSTFTDQWITDRAAMLGWLVKRNLEDNTDITMRGTQDLRFRDEASKTDIRIDAGGLTTGDDNRKKFHFGDDKANTLTGASKEDHLYGGSGADTLEGKDGADYLEGGADSDTYALQTGLTGIDTLVDSGANTLKIDGKTVSGAFAQVAGMGGNIYYSADKSYQLRKAEEGVWRLSVKNESTGQYSAVADLKGWKDGDYGLTIGAPTQEPERVPAVVYPSSVAYLAMDGAAAPKGVTFGGGNKSDDHDDMPRFCVLRKACRAQNRRRGATHSIATGDLQASARCQFNHQHCSAGGIA